MRSLQLGGLRHKPIDGLEKPKAAKSSLEVDEIADSKIVKGDEWKVSME